MSCSDCPRREYCAGIQCERHPIVQRALLKYSTDTAVERVNDEVARSADPSWEWI